MREQLMFFLESEQQDQLHQFRVSVKKIKALLSLLKANRKSNKLLDAFQPVKDIFRHAGVIRDAFIHLELADQLQIKEPVFYQEQKELLLRETMLFLKKGRNYIKTIDAVGKKLKKELGGVKNSQIVDFFKKQLDSIVLALAKGEFDEEMHVCRKRIKNLLYNQKLVSKNLPDNLKLNFPYLDQVQDMLGRWHDSTSAKEYFSTKCMADHRAVEKLNLQISDLEKSVVIVSENFWQRATNRST